MVSIYEEVIKTQKKQTKNIYPFNWLPIYYIIYWLSYLLSYPQLYNPKYKKYSKKTPLQSPMLP
jgi:hypothetical protein